MNMNAREPSQAVLALVLAIASFFTLGPLLSIPGLVIARSEIQAIRAGARDPANLLTAQLAFWFSIANLVVMVLTICIVLAFFLGMTSIITGSVR